jgi:type I restriction enzyme S subunit
MAIEWSGELLRDLLVTTKDGDWGKGEPTVGHVGYHVIRGSDFPDVRVGDLSNVPFRYLPEKTVARRTLEPNDVLIETAGGTKDRPTGRTLLVTPKVLGGFNGPVTCASFARFLRVDQSKADPAFVFWFLQHLYDKGEMDQHQIQHTGVARFQYTKFAETQSVPLPPVPEQKAIAAVLGALDDKIELNRRMNATLEAMARALFQSWFVDFDPVRAKAEGRPPAGLDEPTAALFPAQFQPSELGEIPHGWDVGSLDQIANFLNGLALQKFPPGQEPTLPVIKIAQLRKGDSHGADRCNTDLPPDFIITDGDVLFSWSGSLEVELWCGGPGALNQHLFKVTSEAFPKWFYFLWTRHHLEDFRRTAASKATTMGHIQRKHLSAAKVLMPPPALLKAMTPVMVPLIEHIVANRIQSRTLATLRDTLLPKLLSGELSAHVSLNPAVDFLS